MVPIKFGLTLDKVKIKMCAGFNVSKEKTVSISSIIGHIIDSSNSIRESRNYRKNANDGSQSR